jgi:hypothetical protein
MKKFYAGMILAGMMTAALVATGCTNPVGGAGAYSISLNQTGDYTFPEADAGYGTQTAKTIVVVNTGSRATGALTVTKSGENADSFTLSSASLPGIAPGGTATFTVAPEAGLGSGTYTATIKVSGGNGINASFGVSFTVTGASASISLDVTGTYTFPVVTTGYTPQAKTITVYNEGELATGTLTIGVSNTDFEVSTTSLNNIAVGGSDTFTVAPVQWLGEGDYTATITVSGDGISASFGVSFTVSDSSVYSIGLSETGTYTFDDAITGYGTQSPRTVTVTNTGNAATGSLTIGTTSANFTVTPTTLSNIATGGNDTFTVVPIQALGAGTYTATITVSGVNVTSRNFDVSFTVSDPPAYSIGLSPGGIYDFGEAAPGYGAQSPIIVTVSNTGTQATGNLTIAISGAGFTVSTNSLNNIAVGGNDTFTVEPAPGLGEGDYTATITVSGDHDISASRNVRFTVATTPSYDIWLSENGTYTFNNAVFGYGAQNPLFVTVYNMGTQATGTLTITKSGANPDDFRVSINNLNSIAVSGNDTFTVVPIEGLGVGTHIATITVSGGNGMSARNFDVRFTVTATPQSSNANLGSLSVSPGALNPAFSANTPAYTVLVSDSVTSFTVAAAVADTGKATLTQSPPNPVPLSTASTPITLTVTAENGTTKTYTVTVNRTPAANAIEFTINGGIADEVIDLTKSTDHDLSRDAGDTLRLTAPEGSGYTWLVDMGYSNFGTISPREIELDPNWYGYELGTHTVLLMYMRDGIPYGCEVLFRVVR